MFSLTGNYDAPGAATAWAGTVGASDAAAAEAEAARALNWILVAVKKGTETLPGLVTGALGPLLTATDARVRARAIELLAAVFDRLPSLQLPDNVRAGTNAHVHPMDACNL